LLGVSNATSSEAHNKTMAAGNRPSARIPRARNDAERPVTARHFTEADIAKYSMP
jgi:hypothetical protein